MSHLSWAIPGAGLPCLACWLHAGMKGDGTLGCSVWMAGVNARLPRAEPIEQNTSGNGSAGLMTGCVAGHGALPSPHSLKCLKQT